MENTTTKNAMRKVVRTAVGCFVVERKRYSNDKKLYVYTSGGALVMALPRGLSDWYNNDALSLTIENRLVQRANERTNAS